MCGNACVGAVDDCSRVHLVTVATIDGLMQYGATLWKKKLTFIFNNKNYTPTVRRRPLAHFIRTLTLQILMLV